MCHVNVGGGGGVGADSAAPTLRAERQGTWKVVGLISANVMSVIVASAESSPKWIISRLLAGIKYVEHRRKQLQPD